jgi:hypothetical protein
MPATHITTSGGLISAAFIENVREVGSRQRGVEPALFAIGRGASTRSGTTGDHTFLTVGVCYTIRHEINPRECFSCHKL